VEASQNRSPLCFIDGRVPSGLVMGRVANDLGRVIHGFDCTKRIRTDQKMGGSERGRRKPLRSSPKVFTAVIAVQFNPTGSASKLVACMEGVHPLFAFSAFSVPERLRPKRVPGCRSISFRR